MRIDRKTQRAIQWKLARFRSWEEPRVVDLFAGCGGISLSAQLAGCDIVGAVEFDPLAARSHAINFHPRDSEELIEWHSKPRDISGVDPQEYIRQIRPTSENPLREVDILVGGPPCQAFARVGRAKLREVIEHPEAFLHQDHSGLYRLFEQAHCVVPRRDGGS